MEKRGWKSVFLIAQISLWLSQKYVAGLSDQIGAVRAALQHPIGSPRLKDLVEPDHTVGIIFYDITRPTPDPHHDSGSA